jgi:hypothetical protein
VPHLERVSLPVGRTVSRTGESRRFLHLISEGIVARFRLMENGKANGFAVTGKAVLRGHAAPHS